MSGQDVVQGNNNNNMCQRLGLYTPIKKANQHEHLQAKRTKNKFFWQQVARRLQHVFSIIQAGRVYV